MTNLHLTDEQMEKAMERGAKRQQQMHDSALVASKKHTKLAQLCIKWIELNYPGLFEQFREEVGFTRPYRPRLDRKGKKIVRDK